MANPLECDVSSQSYYRRRCFFSRSFERLIECKLQIEKYELQSDWLSSFCISYFALCTFHFRCGFAALSLWICLSLVGLLSSVHADDAIKIEPAERWSNVFAEAETRWKYRVSSESPVRERAAWRLTINQRTAASGELEVRADADKPAETTIALKWPKVKESTIQAAQLTVSIGDVRHERPVWIFPRDPFADRQDWLKELKLTVFDPPGDTNEVFNDSDIPHERIRSRDALDDVAEGIVIIGEGVSLKKHDGLLDDLRSLAARGIPVLCLASEEGEFTFPGEKPSATAIQLRRADAIRELDKRLDSEWWPKGTSQLRGLHVTAASDDVIVQVRNDVNDWPWCEWQWKHEFAKPSRLIWCGFGLITSWSDGPTPRYLFAKILERLSAEGVSSPTPCGSEDFE